MASDDLREILAEGLEPLGPVVIKRMFGGYGVFLDGLMFGLVSDGVLYLKTDDAGRVAFEREGLAPFTYARADGRTTVMSYWRTPERLLDEPDELVAWAREAMAAARRASAGRQARSRRKAAARPAGDRGGRR